MPKKSKCLKFRNHERKIKLPFITYADFESTFVPEDIGKQNSKEPYTNKY